MTEIQEHNRQILDRVRVHRDELYESILGLEAALSAPARERVRDWTGHVGNALGGLQSAFDRHVEITDRPGGLFEDVMDHAPRLAHATDQLRREHAVLQAALGDARRRVKAVSDRDDVESLRTMGLDLIRALFEHRHRGAELVYETYDVDIGAAD